MRAVPAIARRQVAVTVSDVDTALAGALSLQVLLQHEVIARAGGLPVGNRDTGHSGFGDAAAFNAAARRYDADPDAAAWVVDAGDPRGALEKPLVLRDNRIDPTIPPRDHGLNSALAAAAGRADRITVVPPAGAGQCAFDPEQMLEALDVLSGVAVARE